MVGEEDEEELRNVSSEHAITSQKMETEDTKTEKKHRNGDDSGNGEAE
jgi:hypothetical protein